MKEGTVYLVLNFPRPWPATEEFSILRSESNGTLIEFFALTSGGIKILISENGNILKEFKSQPLVFSNIGNSLINIVWGINKFELFINTKPVVNDDCKESFLVEVKENLTQGQLSIESDAALKACSEWVNWRAHRYSNLKEHAKSDRRIKTLSEQVQELDDATKSLEMLLHEVNNGRVFLFTSLLPILRSLLFWADNNSNKYNPLLFRIAGYYKIALPLYAFPITEEEKLIEKAAEHIVFNMPCLEKKYPNQVIMDFQNWLKSTLYVQRINDPLSDSIYIFERKLALKDLIFEAANTIGSAHYDDDIPIQLDNLSKNEAFGRDLILDFTCKITEVTIFFSNYIIQGINERSIDAED
ncbi:MAG: hypothetical protein WAQ28_17410 [Bacteroidia bacterium]